MYTFSFFFLTCIHTSRAFCTNTNKYPVKEERIKKLAHEIDKTIKILKGNAESYRTLLNIFNYMIIFLSLTTTFIIGLNTNESWSSVMLSVALVCSTLTVLLGAVVSFMKPRYTFVKDMLVQLLELRLSIEIKISKNELNTMGDIENLRVTYQKVISDIHRN